MKILKVYGADVAPTLSQIVGAKPPSGSFGGILNEIIEREFSWSKQ